MDKLTIDSYLIKDKEIKDFMTAIKYFIDCGYNIKDSVDMAMEAINFRSQIECCKGDIK